nr:hypothetical protein [Mycobacterium eburneum]
MKPWRWWWTMPLLIFVGILGPGLAAAHADPATDFATRHAADVCSTLDAFPTVPGLIGVMQGVADTGLSDRDAGAAVAESVIRVCPAHRHLLDEFVAMYLPDRRGVAA